MTVKNFANKYEEGDRQNKYCNRTDKQKNINLYKLHISQIRLSYI